MGEQEKAHATAPSAPASEREAKLPWEKNLPWTLTDQELRMLVITFVGGVGSIVAGAVIIGSAIAIARAFQTGKTLWLLVALTVGVGPVAIIVPVYFRRENARRARYKEQWPKLSKEQREKLMRMELERKRVLRALALPAVISVLSFAYTVLIWIGLAAGVK